MVGIQAVNWKWRKWPLKTYLFIFLPPPHPRFFPFFSPPLQRFLIKWVLGSKNLFCKSWREPQKPRSWHLSRPIGHFGNCRRWASVPSAAALYRYLIIWLTDSITVNVSNIVKTPTQPNIPWSWVWHKNDSLYTSHNACALSNCYICVLHYRFKTCFNMLLKKVFFSSGSFHS